MRNYYNFALVACLMLAACSDNDENNNLTEPDVDASATAYVIAAQTSSAGGTAAYLVTADNLAGGMVTTLGNGFETSYTSATTWIFYGDKYLYRLAYNYGSAGTTAAYYLDSNGKIRQRDKEYNILNFTTYGIYKNKIIAADASSATDTKDSQGNAAYGVHFSIIDVEAETTSTQTVITEDFLGNKERVMFAGLLEANGKIYTAVVPLGLSPYGVAAGGVLPGNEDLVATSDGGTGGGGYTAGTLTGTQYPNECWVAVFDDDTFTNPTLIRTDGISWAAGRMRSAYYQTIWAADNGDVYVFSPSFAKSNSDARQQTTLNSGVMRIKAGTYAFDSSYPAFDIEQAADGNALYRCWHITKDYFLLQMYTKGLNVQGSGTTRLAIFKGDSREFKYVTGLPAPDVIASFSKAPYTENGACYTTVVTTDGAKPTIYKIDPATATASAGLQVEADEIGAIGKLNSITK
ncbi:MAG: DUF4374 domain-containing protein [Muribaculaceae bacterium]